MCGCAPATAAGNSRSRRETLIGCDGARTIVGEEGGFEFEGQGGLGNAITVWIDADLSRYTAHRSGALFVVCNPGSDDIVSIWTCIEPWNEWSTIFVRHGQKPNELSAAARKIPRLSYEEMLEMAACGAKVLHLRCVEYARRYDLPIHVRSSFSNKVGTWVSGHAGHKTDTSQLSTALAGAGEDAEDSEVEQAIISGVAHDRSEAKITVVGVPDRIGEAARIFRVIAAAGINIDMIVQNVSAVATGRTDISFTLPGDDGQAAMSALQQLQDTIGFESLLYDDRIGKVSLIGAGMRSHPGVTATFFGALAEVGVNIEMISTSEIRISVVVDQKDVDEAVNATHKAFELDAAEVEAVVYGGTGR